MKYIDAEKLIAKIKELNLVTKTYDEQVAFNNALAMVVEIIDSLQREMELAEKYQTPDWLWEDKTIDQIAEEYVESVKKCNDAPTWDLIHTAVCYGYGLGKNAGKEQPEVDLEKEIDRFWDLCIKHKNERGGNVIWSNKIEIEVLARHFYELGLNARMDKLPEIEIDKFTDKVDTFKAKYKHPESISIKGAMSFMARMFYQYPNVARQWYEQLPKATMD